MTGYQRIAVVSAAAGSHGLSGVGRVVDRGALVLAAPTSEAKGVAEAVAQAVAGDVRAEVLLTPVRSPGADRGHRLDALVREHARRDRYRDLVVVADRATITLLLRVVAPDQLASGGPVVVVGLRRVEPTVSLPRVAIMAGGIGLLSAVVDALLPLFALPLATAALGLLLLVVPARRRAAREVLLASAFGTVVLLLVVAGSARFPAS